MRFFLILAIFFIPFVFSLEVDYSCPEKVLEDEGFSCDIEIKDGEGSYDIKFEVKEEDKTLSRFWNDEEDSWKSGFYYITSAIESGEKKEFLFMIEEPGKFKPLLKIRKDSKIESFELDIIVEKNEISEEDEEESSGDLENNKNLEKKKQKDTSEENNSKIIKEDSKEETLIDVQEISLISLNSQEERSGVGIEKEPILSKEVLWKAIGVFIIIILGFLLWERI